MNVVVVESPTKAKTINRYLGSDYQVFASYGHVRDLPAKDGSVEPERDFAMSWQVDPKAKKHIDQIAKALAGADKLYLATDPDREGEAIAWHMQDVLAQRKALNGVEVKRIVFHEITKDAVLEALAHPLDVNQELVDAYLARRALDYLVGFTLSPVLWRKLPGSRSAGRVQSVALRLVCEREAEIEVFRADEYWTIDGSFTTAAGAPYSAQLTHLDGKKLGKLGLPDKQAADQAVAKVSAANFQIDKVERKQARRNPAPPFTTSTLQQEASRKLGFSASRTMQVAQRLYEGLDIGGETVGLITYMRTDSVTLSQSALSGCRSFIKRDFGEAYVPDAPRFYRNTSRNAQEAHEAIRPTDMFRAPQSLLRRLDNEQARLYELIWKRTIASQMASAVLDQVAVDIAAQDGSVLLHATGSVVKFDGFFKVYQEGRDDNGDQPADGGNEGSKAGDERDRRLPAMNEGEATALTSVDPEQHFTQPPPRYSEASLVKTLEEHGIGRPSTYASIISTLLQREYAELKSKRFYPTDIGRIVNAFLTNHFGGYVDYDFTARLEDDLDAVSRGEKDWVPLLKDFWEPFHATVEDKDANVSRQEANQARELGTDPKSGKPVSVRMGRYGPYVIIGTAEDEEKPQFYGLQPGQRLDSITLEEALELTKLPRELGTSPDGLEISTNVGRFGPYVKYGSKFVSLKKEDDPYTITLERALELVEEKKKADAEREIKIFEEQNIKILKGRYGPYVTDGKKNARVPKEREPGSLTLEECVELLANAKTRPKRKRVAKKKKADE